MIKRRSDYKICPYCGSALDVGERCDCKDCNEDKKTPERVIKVKPVIKGGIAL